VSKPRLRREAYLLYADDSGGEADEMRSVAAISGPARVLVALERDLRKALSITKAPELKWAELRTRYERLEAARAFLELSAVALAAGALRVDVLLWRPADQSAASRRRSDAQRLRPLYANSWTRAVKAWPAGRWNVFPDQRTGMQWDQWPPSVQRVWRHRGGGLRVLKEAASRRSSCVQLADLLAGLCRQRYQPEPLDGPGARARRNRQSLLEHFVQACATRGLHLRTQDGLLQAAHDQLSVRLLKRLPVLP